MTGKEMQRFVLSGLYSPVFSGKYWCMHHYILSTSFISCFEHAVYSKDWIG